jgi:ATP-dependent exoDNAse (exonuclease V) beta subunit
VLEIVRAWGQPEARFDKLEALHAMARVYEEEQRAGRRAATVPGLCAWLSDQAKAVQPQSRDPDAIHILTYHGAKGLEWPIVILGDLDAGARADPFGIGIEKDQAPDCRNPLAARWVRYWAWPYGEHEKDIALAEASDQSAIGRAAVAAERAERARLLYVGATRARDYLVLLSTNASLPWLEELPGHDGACAISFVEGAIVACGRSHLARRASFEAPETPTVPVGEEVLFGPRPVELVAQLPLRHRPSAALGDGQWCVAKQVRLGDRFALSGKPDMAALGEACHRFFAADDLELDAEARLHLANANLLRWGAPQLAAADLVLASDRLTAFLKDRFPNGQIRREWPVHGAVGEQIIDGRLDLLVEQPAGYIIVDHKSFPAVVENNAERLMAAAGQLSTIHSAKGQEWKSVFLLNVVDGCLPSDLGTGSTPELEEERRLLYVAMTRAKDDLHLVVPHRFFTHGQNAYGDRHVYASRTRFIPAVLLPRFESTAWPPPPGPAGHRRETPQVRIDVGARMRAIWR